MHIVLGCTACTDLRYAAYLEILATKVLRLETFKIKLIGVCTLYLTEEKYTRQLYCLYSNIILYNNQNCVYDHASQSVIISYTGIKKSLKIKFYSRKSQNTRNNKN